MTRIHEVDLDALEERGAQALLIDLDNTVCRWKREEIDDECVEWVEQAKQRFKLCFVSNSIRPRRLNRVAGRLGIPAVGRWGFGRKPFRGGLMAALKTIDVSADKAVMIGDQIMTDVLGGNRLGMYTVWVQPLHSHEFPLTKVSRLIEKLLIARFRKLGIMPGNVV